MGANHYCVTMTHLFVILPQEEEACGQFPLYNDDKMPLRVAFKITKRIFIITSYTASTINKNNM